MILLRWLGRIWKALAAPPPPRLPGPRTLPSYARMGRYIAGGAALDPRVDLLVRQLAAELSGCRWCIEHGLHRWRKAFLPVTELGALRHYAASPLFSSRERAALAFTEAVSRYTDRAGGIPDAVLAELRCHFSEQEVAALTLAVAGEHFFNPTTGALSGDASVCQAAFVDGLSDGQIEALFRAQRDAEYAELARTAAEVARERGGGSGGGGERESSGDVARLERRLAEIVALDHFGAPGRRAAEAALTRARDRHRPGDRPRTAAARPTRPVHGRTWVTRSGVHVDRIASAWLIRRFIDPKARFRFVAAQDARTTPDELRFDMFEAEYTHEGDRCTFETLAARFGLIDPGLVVIGELVHDIDCKDGKFGRTETAGVERMIAGIVRRHASDDARLEIGRASCRGRV